MPSSPFRWYSGLLDRRMLVCVFTGFSSGLPLFLLINLLPAWLRSEHVDLKAIGLFALIQFPYTWKFVWSPLIDRYAPMVRWLGRRRGWMALSQLALAAAIPVFGWLDPLHDLKAIAALAALLSLFSATQDIAIDAYRRELLDDEQQGLGNAIHVNAYRIAGLVPGSLSLILADHMPWSSVFAITALFMLPGVIATLLLSPNPSHSLPAPRTLEEAVTGPFKEFVSRHGTASTALIIAFMCFYKLGDNMATAMSTAFYLDIGFTKTEVGMIAKHAGLWPAVIGGMLGGVWMLKIGLNRALWLFGAMQLTAVLGFAVLSEVGHNLWMLATAISLEYLGIGLGTAAFVAFIARTTHPRFAATQLALFTSLAVVPRTLVNASTGWLAEQLGWTGFFELCFVAGLPGMLLLLWIAPWNGNAEHTPDA